jgi:hypothetical protein
MISVITGCENYRRYFANIGATVIEKGGDVPIGHLAVRAYPLATKVDGETKMVCYPRHGQNRAREILA